MVIPLKRLAFGILPEALDIKQWGACSMLNNFLATKLAFGLSIYLGFHSDPLYNVKLCTKILFACLE